MGEKKVITVFGANGNQGGSVVNVFLNDPKLKHDWSIRGITRDTSKDASKKLESWGVEMVSADMEDKASLVKAFTGSHTVFAATNYWEKMDMQVEIQQGKNIVDAAKETGIQHLIWSSLDHVTKKSNGKLTKVYHFDSKAEVEEYANQSGVPVTHFLPGFFATNFLFPGTFKPCAGETAWIMNLPVADSTQLPVIDIKSDVGKWVKAIVLKRDQVLGRRILGATKYVTAKEALETFMRLFPETGKTASYNQIPQDVYIQSLLSRGMPQYVADEFLEMFMLFEQFGYFFGEPLEESQSILEDPLTSLEEFFKRELKDLK